MASPLWNLGTSGYLWLSSLTHTKLSRISQSKTMGQDQDTGQAFPTESRSREEKAASCQIPTAALCTTPNYDCSSSHPHNHVAAF